jgi:phosphopantothenoylcysteine decarboxylase / phosphopantothenate---cysteine ligase
MARVVLGVGAGIAAYKACELLRLFREAGHAVRVVPTPDALRFVGAPTWEALSGEPVTTDVWNDVPDVPHVRIGKTADLVVVAPATADLLARAATGLASDLLTATLLTARCPAIYAPAMHTEMWEHPATRANVATLRERGATVLDPAAGRLTGADSGPGRLPDPAEIFAAAVALAHHPEQDLAGRRVVVSAGGTREEIDPVRFIGNWSSGLQGYALARAAAARGAQAIVVAANVTLPDPAGVRVRRVVSASDMRAAMLDEAADADAVVMAAAVADYRPVSRSASKMKKDGGPPEPLTLTENPDILAELSARRPREGQVVVGFAAETDPDLEAARAKLKRKGCDLLVLNQVGDGRAFGTLDNEGVILGADGTVTEIARESKDVFSHVVWDLVVARIAAER